MEFLWVWAYNMSGPLTWVIGGALLICLIVFAQSMTAANQRAGGSVSLGSVYAALVLGLIGAIVYSIPSPTYDQKIVYKDRVKVVEKPVVKKVVAVKQTITRTITKNPTRDTRVSQCLARSDMTRENCTTWAIRMEKPRIIEKRINVHHYKTIYKDGKMIVEKFPAYDERLRYCLENAKRYSYSDCHNLALEAPAAKPIIQTRVVKIPSKYEDVFKYCNEKFSLDGTPNAAAIRNERLKICDAAARAAAFK